MELDKKDEKLLTILQENGRASLTIIAKALNLSIDATHKRMKKLKANGVIQRYGIFIDPKNLGYDLVVVNKIKLTNVTKEAREKFIAYLTELPECIELISISGEDDFTCVLISENSKKLNEMIYSIREKFKGIISDWKSAFNLEVYKFEKYTFR